MIRIGFWGVTLAEVQRDHKGILVVIRPLVRAIRAFG